MNDRVRVEWSTISDFVIVRSDGAPLFFLANAIDYLEMGITHVINAPSPAATACLAIGREVARIVLGSTP